jgi:hypothetical protein
MDQPPQILRFTYTRYTILLGSTQISSLAEVVGSVALMRHAFPRAVSGLAPTLPTSLNKDKTFKTRLGPAQWDDAANRIGFVEARDECKINTDRYKSDSHMQLESVVGGTLNL